MAEEFNNPKIECIFTEDCPDIEAKRGQHMWLSTFSADKLMQQGKIEFVALEDSQGKEPVQEPESKTAKKASPKTAKATVKKKESLPESKEESAPATRDNPNGNRLELAMASPNFMDKLKKVMPDLVSAKRFASIALTVVRKNPDLQKCEVGSLMGALVQAAELDLEPGSGLGFSYIIPRWSGKLGYTEACFQLGYKGAMELAHRSGAVLSFQAQVVREGDEFAFEYGLKENLVHKPNPKCRGNDFIAAYAYCMLKGGGYAFQVIYPEDWKKAEAMSKGGTIWKDHPEPMIAKTAILRLCNKLPKSAMADLQRAVSLDQEAEYGGDAPIIDVDLM